MLKVGAHAVPVSLNAFQQLSQHLMAVHTHPMAKETPSLCHRVSQPATAGERTKS